MNLKPTFQLGLFYKVRNGREDKLGGLAFGFPAERWPTCFVCGRPQNFIGQFHHSDVLNLGQEGRALYLFQCPDGALCGDWDYLSGANAAVILNRDEQTGVSTPSPEGAEVEPEAIIVGWDATEPSPWDSYLGALPSYGPNHQEGSEPPGRFLVQLVGTVAPEGPPPSPVETGAEHLHYWGGEFGQDHMRVEAPPTERRHYGAWSRGQVDLPGRPSQVLVRETGEWFFEWANFGGGTAYVFVDDEAKKAFMFSER